MKIYEIIVLEKINHHGKRADAIVKGMLQHSRSSGIEKEPIDINKLADEYLRRCKAEMWKKENTVDSLKCYNFERILDTDYLV